MTKMHLLDSILTEFDDSISSELNVDPLGLLVIWSSYGQNIFKRRISSISNDVRSFTLNLFNHAVIRSLIKDDSVVLGKGLADGAAYSARGKDSFEFKKACLIYLENIFTYSMVKAQDEDGVDTTGIPGISKARRSWEASTKNPNLLFSNDPKAHILKNQNSLGVSGRYKTPLIEMKFFNSTYDYDLPEAQEQWKNVEVQLLAQGKPLATLYTLVRQWLAKLLVNPHRIPQHPFSELPDNLKAEIVKTFPSSASVGAQTRDFWLALTKLDKGASGALYQQLQQEWNPDNPAKQNTSSDIFTQAASSAQLSPDDKSKLEHVRLLEPFLAELDLLLGVMLSAKSQSLQEATNTWKALGRNARTLPDKAAPIKADLSMQKQVDGMAASRLGELVTLARSANMQQQMQGLLQYHAKVMQARGQSPWLRLSTDQQLKVDVRTRQLPQKDKRPVGSWVHHYYLPQFRHLLSGLRGDV